jgi:hypothetical protein
VRRVRRNTESDNIVFLTVLVECMTAVALVVVYNEQTVRANSTLLCMRIKVLQPPHTKLVCFPAVYASLSRPFTRQV